MKRFSDLCCPCRAGLWTYRAAQWFAGLFAVAHLVAIPIRDAFLRVDSRFTRPTTRKTSMAT